MTKTTEAIVTGTAAAIVTALGDGPSSALDLSQRLPVTYANIRQHLRRMTQAGIVTRLQRGLYSLHCDSATTSGAVQAKAKTAGPVVTPRIYGDAQIDRAVSGAWAHFEAMNDMHRPEAWA